MTENKTPKTLTLGTVLKWLVALDLVWALAGSTLQTLILNEAGMAIGANGAATKIAAGATFIQSFFVNVFVGGGLIFFISLISCIWIWVHGFLTDKQSEPTRRFWNRVFCTMVCLTVGWALLSGLYSAAVIAGIGTASAVHASGLVVAVAGALAFVVSFATGIFIGLVFFTVIGGGAFVLLTMYAFFSKATKSSAGDTGNAGDGTTGGDQPAAK